jgi:phosphatidylglycerol---prolipoprotein diacylglyceryl transferase
MVIFNYLIWNASPEIVTVWGFSLRWYGLFFALGFLISQQILYHIYKAEGKPEKDVDTLTIYMVISTIIGARLGHVIFYQPEIIWQNPESIFLPFEFSPEFKFTGLQGLASHGAAIGILFALWLFSRKKKPGQNYLQVLDRIVILVALTGALIRLGNFFNSEIIGKPTDKPWGVVFTSRLSDTIDKNVDLPDGLVDSYLYRKNDSIPAGENGRRAMTAYIFFRPGVSVDDAEHFCNTVKQQAIGQQLFFDEFSNPQDQDIGYRVEETKPGEPLIGRINLTGIARHPAQLYESISCVILFLLLLWIWNRHKQNLVPGTIFGIFLVWLWTMRFLSEFLKENQEEFESKLPINMGQILSIPLIIAGIIIVFVVLRKKADEKSGS